LNRFLAAKNGHKIKEERMGERVENGGRKMAASLIGQWITQCDWKIYDDH